MHLHKKGFDYDRYCLQSQKHWPGVALHSVSLQIGLILLSDMKNYARSCATSECERV